MFFCFHKGVPKVFTVAFPHRGNPNPGWCKCLMLECSCDIPEPGMCWQHSSVWVPVLPWLCALEASDVFLSRGGDAALPVTRACQCSCWHVGHTRRATQRLGGAQPAQWQSSVPVFPVEGIYPGLTRFRGCVRNVFTVLFGISVCEIL